VTTAKLLYTQPVNILTVQGYGIFTFIWQFVIPLFIFVVAYWEIFRVVRRQAKIAADRHRSTTTSKETVAGTSREISRENGRDKGVDRGTVTVGSKGHCQAKGQKGSSRLSNMQINVVRTMIYIIVCFTVCWMPMYTAVMIRRLDVHVG